MQEAVAFAYGWPPPVLDDLTLDELEMWADVAQARIAQRLQSRCAFLKKK